MSDVLDDVIKNATVKVATKADPTAHISEGGEEINPYAKSLFGITDASSVEQSEKANEVWEMAKEIIGKDEDMEVVEFLKDVKFRIGVKPLDKTYLQHVYQYVKLRLASKNLNEQAKAMEL